MSDDRLEREFRAELRQYQEECQMPYVTSIERLAKEEGIQEGRLETLRETIIDVLRVRFTTIPPTMNEMLASLEDGTLLRQLHLQAITISSIEEFQQLLSQHIKAG
jgi:hypothetical protein